MTQLKMLSTDDKLTEIRRLYFNTSKSSIEQDLAKALDLLKSMESEDDREKATVYMEGLAEMQKDWLKQSARPKGAGGAGGAGKPRRPGGAGKAGGGKPAGRRSGPAAQNSEVRSGAGAGRRPARPRGKAR